MELRLRVVREIVDEGVPIAEVARVFGLGVTTIGDWVRRYRERGLDGLVPGPLVRPAVPKAPDPRREAVTALKEEHPEFGTRRIADVLRRFSALGVAESTVRRILHEEGLLEAREPTPAREHPERRFERAQPNELWQSDIFTFLLRRHERLYLAAFMDDHSRFLVGHAIAHHQRSGLVLEALDRGIAAYGTPREILTDQGRQYTAWRGTTEFEEELRRQGIRHVKSRPQHPQTLGKIERFWKTLWEELLSRTVFADFADCARRLALFVDGYNFQRPHQALAGLVPADRFFRSAPEVRAAVERSVQANALRLAKEQPPLKPFYLVGRLGDRDLSIAAGADGLLVKVGSEAQTIRMPKEDDHERGEASKRVEGPADEEAPFAAGAEVDPGAAGAGRDGEAPLPAHPVGPLRREAGVGRDRGERAVAEHLLPAGGEGARRDAVGARADAAGPEAGPERGGGGAAGEGNAAGGGQAARRAAPAAHAEDGEAGPADAPGPGSAALDDEWRDAFERLAPEEPGGREPLDPDAGWRGRALTWERKLAGADAGSDAASGEVLDGEEDLRAGAGGATGAARALRDDAGGAPGADHGERGGAAPRDVAEPLPDADAPRAEEPARRDHAGRAGPAGEAGAGGGAGAGERAPEPGGGTAPGTDRDDRPAPGGGERGDPGAGEVLPVEEAERGGRGE
ncbi:MAG TPA: IS481 family transposase [Anaeromyxobacteraceae bacterium]|nr:IS481 family transposase [Anaeromyxobacteraceae bacterium]